MARQILTLIDSGIGGVTPFPSAPPDDSILVPTATITTWRRHFVRALPLVGTVAQGWRQRFEVWAYRESWSGVLTVRLHRVDTPAVVTGMIEIPVGDWAGYYTQDRVLTGDDFQLTGDTEWKVTYQVDDGASPFRMFHVRAVFFRLNQ